MAIYGQVVVGPPGSGKTTYCNGMQQYLRLIGRETLVVNLDPANEYYAPQDDDSNTSDANEDSNESDSPSASHLPYDTLLDASDDIINLSSVMNELNLGPNGGLVYCMEYIQHHISTLIQLLKDRLDSFEKTNNNQRPPYLLFDFPGQVELFTHCTCVQSILDELVKALDLRLCAIHLVDAHSCMEGSKFISAALLSTTTMLRLELPAVNVLSKVDLLGTYGSAGGGGGGGGGEDTEENVPFMAFNLDFFMECQDLDRLLPYLNGEEPLSGTRDQDEVEHRIFEENAEYRDARRRTRQSVFYRKHEKLHRELCEVIDDYSLLSYVPLNINDATSVGRVVAKVDKANGYVFLGEMQARKSNGDIGKPNVEDMFQCAMQADGEWGYEQIADVQERFMGLFREEIPSLRKKDMNKK